MGLISNPHGYHITERPRCSVTAINDYMNRHIPHPVWHIPHNSLQRCVSWSKTAKLFQVVSIEFSGLRGSCKIRDL